MFIQFYAEKLWHGWLAACKIITSSSETLLTDKVGIWWCSIFLMLTKRNLSYTFSYSILSNFFSLNRKNSARVCVWVRACYSASVHAYVLVCMLACVRECTRAYVCVYVRAFVPVCVRTTESCSSISIQIVWTSMKIVCVFVFKLTEVYRIRFPLSFVFRTPSAFG